MMRLIKYVVVVLLSLFILKQGSAQNTQGDLAFSVLTATYNGHYAPRNSGVIWVADGNDQFVKTLKVWAIPMRKHLVKWKEMSGGNIVDAITGPTYNTHKEVSVFWDCTDVNGQVVPDGEYKVYIEFTEANSLSPAVTDGPVALVSFQKSAEPVLLTPPDLDSFKEMRLEFSPKCTAINNMETIYIKPVSPNPANTYTELKISLSQKEYMVVSVYDVNGRKIKTVFDGNLLQGEQSIFINTDIYGNGIYYLGMNCSGKVFSQKILIQH